MYKITDEDLIMLVINRFYLKGVDIDICDSTLNLNLLVTMGRDFDLRCILKNKGDDCDIPF